MSFDSHETNFLWGNLWEGSCSEGPFFHLHRQIRTHTFPAPGKRHILTEKKRKKRNKLGHTAAFNSLTIALFESLEWKTV